ncbi:hypothetical protein [Natrinema sp. 1APR25-10V2]|uniref:hypothetical protein n=1 Tax=Natrinema sp. 1APR25-10V2 TaxID=2951081 RepID=UPI002875D29F|nr:hypothetical protein [Natrinema sp. 1APR25-10V2]MDS0478381.1 hypothetical protein [Natrinema sp. 1APR25-10V2]
MGTVNEFTDHNFSERRAIATVDGFVVFVEAVPDDCEVTDVIRSFNRGHTLVMACLRETA